jgi:mono/diheme cytochrome c family protein
VKKNAGLVLALAVAALVGCYTGPDIGAAPGQATIPAATEPAATTSRGLPCDVAAILTKHCVSCHAEPPTKGARSALVSRELLAGPWEEVSSLAQASVDRMRDAMAPMPPEGLLPEADVVVLEKWIAAGMPEGTCGETSVAPAPVALHCTSKKYWTKDDDDGSELMTPGRACIACHDLENGKGGKTKDDDDDDDDDDELEAPAFTAAGTLYPTLHEPDNCYGITSLDAKVILEGADGKTVTLDVNAAGNFMTEGVIALPYRATVVRGGKTRVMKTAQKSGDCNACHSAEASEAPGRIVAP